MEGILREFIEVMGRQNLILDQIVDIGQQKQRIIVAGKVKELDSLIQKESMLISNLENLEGARFKLQQQIGTATAEQAAVSAGELLEWAGREYPQLKGHLEETINRLSYNLARLKAINLHNNELIEQSLQYIETMQAMLNGDIAGTYSDKGRPAEDKSGRKVNLLDTRA